MTPREQCLAEARALISSDRAEQYGDLGENAETFRALMAAVYRDARGFAAMTDYPLAMILVKIARLAQNPTHLDSWVDIAGYAGLGYEIAKEG